MKQRSQADLGVYADADEEHVSQWTIDSIVGWIPHDCTLSRMMAVEEMQYTVDAAAATIDVPSLYALQ